MPRGGYQKPKNGAQVSAPGALSKRKAVEKTTQNQPLLPTGSSYGQRAAMQQQLEAAPLAGKNAPMPSQPKMNIDAAAPMGQGNIPLTADTERPGEPITEGMSFGPGSSPAEIGLNLGTGMPDSPQKQDLVLLSNYLPMIERAANSEDAPQSLRTFVQYLKAQPEQVAPPQEV